VLAVMDTAPRTAISDAEHETLEDLAQMAMREMERRREQRTHRQRLEQAEQFFLRCPEPLCMASLEGHFLRVNPAFADTTGYTIEELMGRPYLDMVHPEDYEDTVAVVDQLAEGEEVDVFTIRIEHKDGSYRWFEWNSLVCERGIIFAAARDVTERVRAEAELKESQRRLCAAERIAQVGHWEWIVEGKELIWSEGMYRIFGERPSTFEPSYERYLERIHPDDRGRVERIVEAALEGQESYSIEYRLVRPDGTVRHVRGRAEVRFDEDGAPDRMVGTLLDITARKAVEEKLMHIQEAVESASDAIAIVSPKGQFVYVNPAFEELFGVTRETLNAMEQSGPRLFVDPERGKEVLETVRHGREWTGEIEMKTREGEVVQIALRGSPITDERGDVVGIVGIHTDITERKRAEEALMETEKLAATGRMAAGIAHEINNPLASIKNAFQLVKRSIPEEAEYRRYAEHIEHDIDRIRRIVHQMYTLYSPDPEAPSRTRLARLLEDTKLVLEPTAREQQVSIEIESKSEHEPVWLAEGYLRQVLYNLITNAIQVSLPDSTVQVKVAYEAEDVVVRVIDEGPGIPPALQGQIFEPFFTARSTEASGLGLGLSISKTLVESMGGSIRFDTEPGKGAVFTVRLPKRPPSNPASGQSPSAPGLSSL